MTKTADLKPEIVLTRNAGRGLNNLELYGPFSLQTGVFTVHKSFNVNLSISVSVVFKKHISLDYV